MAEVDREDLEALLQDPDFLQLSSRTKTLNLFEAVGATHYELRHSDFLAFLLDPGEPHGLGDRFLEEFLAVATRGILLDVPLNSLEVRLRDLDSVEVRREWRNIDLLLLAEDDGWVCAIENKVRSSEHGDQLSRYKEMVEQEFPNLDHLFLYLTPNREDPSDEDYLAVDYEAVVEALETAWARKQEQLPTKAEHVLEDYIEIVRRHVMEESEVTEICQEIYAKHKDAIDLIMKHRPSVMDPAREYLQELLPELADEFELVEDDSKHNLLRYCPEEIDSAELQMSDGWTSTNRILLLEVDSRSSSVSLNLVMGPGDQSFRQEVFEWLKEQKDPFLAVSGSEPNKSWQRLYKETLLTDEDLEQLFIEEGEEAALEQLGALLRRRLEEDLPEIVRAIKGSRWYPEA